MFKWGYNSDQSLSVRWKRKAAHIACMTYLSGMISTDRPAHRGHVCRHSFALEEGAVRQQYCRQACEQRASILRREHARASRREVQVKHVP
eukprot:6190780-Pleurochrysis_carterae.AAC.6